jgi:hypothetical protein
VSYLSRDASFVKLFFSASTSALDLNFRWKTCRGDRASYCIKIGLTTTFALSAGERCSASRLSLVQCCRAELSRCQEPKVDRRSILYAAAKTEVQFPLKLSI